MSNLELANYWDILKDYGVATFGELQLITNINGYNEETLNSVLYARTGYRNLDQFIDADAQ